MTLISPQQITAVILAGGMGKRMGGLDKGQVKLNGQPLIDYIIAAIRPQVAAILINANRNQDLYSRFGYPVLSDQLQDYQGPLAGFTVGMHAATTSYIVTIPCDGPFVAPDLVARLLSALNSQTAALAVAHDGARIQPVYALIPVSLRNSLDDFLASGQRKIECWYTEHKIALADFSDLPQAFTNINSPADRKRLERNLATRP